MWLEYWPLMNEILLDERATSDSMPCENPGQFPLFRVLDAVTTIVILLSHPTYLADSACKCADNSGNHHSGHQLFGDSLDKPQDSQPCKASDRHEPENPKPAQAADQNTRTAGNLFTFLGRHVPFLLVAGSDGKFIAVPWKSWPITLKPLWRRF